MPHQQGVEGCIQEAAFVPQQLTCRQAEAPDFHSAPVLLDALLRTIVLKRAGSALISQGAHDTALSFKHMLHVPVPSGSTATGGGVQCSFSSCSLGKFLSGLLLSPFASLCRASRQDSTQPTVPSPPSTSTYTCTAAEVGCGHNFAVAAPWHLMLLGKAGTGAS